MERMCKRDDEQAEPDALLAYGPCCGILAVVTSCSGTATGRQRRAFLDLVCRQEVSRVQPEEKSMP